MRKENEAIKAGLEWLKESERGLRHVHEVLHQTVEVLEAAGVHPHQHQVLGACVDLISTIRDTLGHQRVAVRQQVHTAIPHRNADLVLDSARRISAEAYDPEVPDGRPAVVYEFTGTCSGCGELVADGRTVHRECAEVRP